MYDLLVIVDYIVALYKIAPSGAIFLSLISVLNVEVLVCTIAYSFVDVNTLITYERRKKYEHTRHHTARQFYRTSR